MKQKGFVPVIILLAVVLIGSLGYLAYTKHYLNYLLNKNISLSIPGLSKNVSRFENVKDNLNDKIDPKTKWRVFTSESYYVTFLYPPNLTRNSADYWSDPPTTDPISKPDVFLTLSNNFNKTTSDSDFAKLLNMKTGENITLNSGKDDEVNMSKTGEKTNGNFSGSVYVNNIKAKTYWTPFYSSFFISDLLPRGKRIIIQLNFKTQAQRDGFAENFLKIVNSATYLDFDMNFIRDLGFINNKETIKLVSSINNGGVYFLDKADNTSDQNGELFQLEKQDGTFAGYVISRKVNLKELLGKRIIVTLRKIDGFLINNKEVFFIDQVNTI